MASVAPSNRMTSTYGPPCSAPNVSAAAPTSTPTVQRPPPRFGRLKSAQARIGPRGWKTERPEEQQRNNQPDGKRSRGRGFLETAVVAHGEGCDAREAHQTGWSL